jgi:hypothetical protein
MKVRPLILCISVAFCIGTLATIFDVEKGDAHLPEQTSTTTYQVHAANILTPLILTLWALVVLVALSGRTTLHKQRLVEDLSWKKTLVLLIGLCLCLVVVFFFSYFKEKLNFENILNLGRPFQINSPLSGPIVLRPPTTAERALIYLGAGVLVVLIILLIVALITFTRKKRYAGRSILEKVELEKRKRQYSFEGSYRDVVIDAYGASCDHLEEKGFDYQEGKTPAEFKDVVKDPDLERLTYLFEKARYSHHHISRTDSERALSHYRRLKDED